MLHPDPFFVDPPSRRMAAARCKVDSTVTAEVKNSIEKNRWFSIATLW